MSAIRPKLESVDEKTPFHLQDEDLKCAICLNDTMEKVATLICGHSFDDPCIKNAWKYQEKINCPVCKADVGILPTDDQALKKLQNAIERGKALQQACDERKLESVDEVKLPDPVPVQQIPLEQILVAGMLAELQNAENELMPFETSHATISIIQRTPEGISRTVQEFSNLTADQIHIHIPRPRTLTGKIAQFAIPVIAAATAIWHLMNISWRGIQEFND